jgi:hypothetical protein
MPQPKVRDLSPHQERSVRRWLDMLRHLTVTELKQRLLDLLTFQAANEGQPFSEAVLREAWVTIEHVRGEIERRKNQK